MAERSGPVLASDTAVDCTIAGSATVPRLRPPRSTRSGEARGMFGDVPAPLRMRMQVVVCASTSPETALPDVIALLVPGTSTKRAAVVEAITTNDPLREQWERTWHTLRP